MKDKSKKLTKIYYLHKGDINSFLRGKQKQAGGFIWKYA